MAAIIRKPVTQTAIGIGLSVATNFTYDHAVNEKVVVGGVNHYHWGLLSLIVASESKKLRYYGLGFGGGLIAGEAAEANPFDLANPDPIERTINFGLTALLGGVLLVSAVKHT